MCGLAGFTGITDPDTRETLTWLLGFGIDDRGGDAAGFVTLAQGDVIEGRKLGFWASAKERFIRRAARGETTLMHARYATCGKKHISEAHPFKIMRGGAPILWGAHNGMIWDAEESAELHGRPYTVDSKELFELLADNQIDLIKDLTGYGVITWVEADNPDNVLLCRMTYSGDIHVVRTECGGTVWGSTAWIVDRALQGAGLKEHIQYEKPQVGVVYRITPKGMFHTSRPEINLSGFSYGGKAWHVTPTDRDDERILDNWEDSEWYKEYCLAEARSER